MVCNVQYVCIRLWMYAFPNELRQRSVRLRASIRRVKHLLAGLASECDAEHDYAHTTIQYNTVMR